MAHTRLLSARSASALGTHRVLRNTYALLSMTLLFSAAVAALSAALNWPHPGLFMTLAGYFGLLYLTHRTRNSAWGLASVFALTGFMGLTLGPIINMYLMRTGGAALVASAFGLTGAIFLALSAYVWTTRRDFSAMGGMLMVGILTAFFITLGLAVAGMFGVAVSGFLLGMSALWVLLMAGLILYQTSAIIHGGETNYIMATVTLYVSLYNLFSSLLHLLGAFADE